MTLNVKPLKKVMYFWLPRIAYPKLTPLCINYKTNALISVLQKRILYIMLPVRTSSLCESILVESFFFLLCPHTCFVILFKSSLLYFYLVCILSKRVCFSRVKLNRTKSGRQRITLSLLSEFILVG